MTISDIVCPDIGVQIGDELVWFSCEKLASEYLLILGRCTNWRRKAEAWFVRALPLVIGRRRCPVQRSAWRAQGITAFSLWAQWVILVVPIFAWIDSSRMVDAIDARDWPPSEQFHLWHLWCQSSVITSILVSLTEPVVRCIRSVACHDTKKHLTGRPTANLSARWPRQRFPSFFLETFSELFFLETFSNTWLEEASTGKARV